MPDEGCRPAAGYHESCLGLWGPEMPAWGVDDFSGTTIYTFMPSYLDDRRRRDRIRHFLCYKLRNLFPSAHLPLEIWHMVVNDELLRMCAVYSICELWERRNSSDVELDMARGIWAHYVHIEGVRCIERLTNTPPADAAGCLYVLEDYLGIRQLVAATLKHDLSALSATSVATAEERDNMWWRTVPIQQGDMLRAMSDTVNYTPVDCKDKEWGDWHMASILMVLHTHHGNEKDLSFYLPYDVPEFLGFCLFVYFPLAKGERLAEVFGRRSDRDSHMGLLFRTNRGRDMVIGPDLPTRSGHYQHLRFRHICSLPPDKPTRIHYNSSPRGIRRLIFEDAHPAWHPAVLPARLLQDPGFSATGILDHAAA
ncbi:hypothetical protein SCUCBS95973_004679 [Sporothrix curviconia]|uniref:Uncharacterized protein n=1 Tax=Sporothrix curviconia TaxID=1260050 RepID=A0ABP0BQM9_9PEZI